jgi:hypothetical protein
LTNCDITRSPFPDAKESLEEAVGRDANIVSPHVAISLVSAYSVASSTFNENTAVDPALLNSQTAPSDSPVHLPSILENTCTLFAEVPETDTVR